VATGSSQQAMRLARFIDRAIDHYTRIQNRRPTVR